MCLPALPLIAIGLGGAGLAMQYSAQKKAEEERRRAAEDAKKQANQERTAADTKTRAERGELYDTQAVARSALASFGTSGATFGPRSFFTPRA